MTGHRITADDVAWARRVANYGARRFPALDTDDAEGAALLALVEVAKRWRQDGGAAFRTLAFRRIQGAVFDLHRALPGNSRYEARRVRFVELDEDSHPAVEGEQEGAVLRHQVARGLALLPVRERSLLRRRLAGATQQEAFPGFSKPYACRTEAGAIAALRAVMGVA